MEVNPVNKFRLHAFKDEALKTLLLVFIILIFLSCKKNNPKEVIVYETIPAEYDLSYNSTLIFVKNPGGFFDTTISLGHYFSKFYKVQEKSYPYEKAVVTCNNYNADLAEIDPPNKLSMVSPSCFWKTSSPELGTFSYHDQQVFPSFSDQQWWKIDSINSNEELLIDVSNFKNYSSIIVSSLNLKTRASNVQSFVYQPGLTNIKLDQSFFKDLNGLNEIGINFNNSIVTQVNGYKSTFIKTISFGFFNKIY